MHAILALTLLFAQYDFTIARVKYGGGGDWYADPSSLPNLLTAIEQRLNIRTPPREDIIEITDPKLYNYPYIYLTGHGKIHFTSEEIKILRNYFAAGGFLHADDNYALCCASDNGHTEVVKLLKAASRKKGQNEIL